MRASLSRGFNQSSTNKVDHSTTKNKRHHSQNMVLSFKVNAECLHTQPWWDTGGETGKQIRGLISPLTACTDSLLSVHVGLVNEHNEMYSTMNKCVWNRRNTIIPGGFLISGCEVICHCDLTEISTRGQQMDICLLSRWPKRHKNSWTPELLRPTVSDLV